MSKKRVIDWLQNITLVGLVVLTVLLLSRFSMMEGALSGRMQTFFSMPQSVTLSDGDISGAVAAVHIAVTDDIEYGRYTKLNVPTNSDDFTRLALLLREAIGSASVPEAATDATFRAAMEAPGVYVDLAVPMPLACAAAWLGAEYGDDRQVRALALTAGDETAVLYVRCADGTVLRSGCALSSGAICELTADFAPNGGRFAYESDYDPMKPYTILVQEVEGAVNIRPGIPGGFSAYNLLSALGFNAHTYSRYVDSTGVEVIFQSPHTLRISTDGTVEYSVDGESDLELFRIAAEDGTPTSVEVLRGACDIAAVLTGGTDASPLVLEEMEKTDGGWIVSFRYCVNGVWVRPGDDRAALRIVIDGDAITSFVYKCRAYTSTEHGEVLLPPSMAVAIASLHKGAELTMAYVDSGAEEICVGWFAE